MTDQPQTSAAATMQVSDLCKCGHPAHMHPTSLGRPGPCSAQIDKRPITVGGPELHPCPCRNFVPMGWSNVSP